MKSLALLGIVLLALSAVSCSAFAPSQGSIQTAIALTRSAQPSESPLSPTTTFTPTLEPSPTFTPVPTDTATPSPTPGRYFIEEFDQALGPDWSQELLGPGSKDPTDLETEFKDGRLRFTIDAQNIYAYYFYDRYIYTDVRVEMSMVNFGHQSNQISLVCRRSAKGWYEFSVGSDGAWVLWAYVGGKGTNARYSFLTNGVTLDLNQGGMPNEYTLTCSGESIHMLVNGVEVKGSPYNDIYRRFTEGSVGFNASSIEVFPVIVDIQWFKVSEP